MKIIIEIQCNNAAFDPLPGIETARILRKLSDYFEHWPEKDSWDKTVLMDLNGNRVGKMEVYHV